MPDADLLARNERAMRAFLDGMERQDEALIRSGFHDDVILRLPRPSMVHKTIAGGDNLARFLAELSRAAYVNPHATTDMCWSVSQPGWPNGGCAPIWCMAAITTNIIAGRSTWPTG